MVGEVSRGEASLRRKRTGLSGLHLATSNRSQSALAYSNQGLSFSSVSLVCLCKDII